MLSSSLSKSMSYDNSKSAPSSNTRGRVTRADEKENDKEASSGESDSPNNIGGQPGSIVAKLEHGGGAGARSSSPSGASGSRGSSGDQRGPTSDDTDGLSSGNDSGERESETGMERENRSDGHQSTHSSSRSKDSAMMLSNKSSNSQSLSPPSGSLAYSLLSTSSERDPPSTSGCSSDQSARVQTQKELMKALKELKIRLPAERRGKSHSSTLDALKYALNCVKQVRANQEYYHQWSVEECHGCSLDLSTFTHEELDNITSEYTLKNTDTFSMAVSFLTGKVVYISPQGSYLLRCKPERLQGTVFSELLAPQDVSTFYSGTAPCRLPAWATCIGSVSPPMDCTQEKSMFCRISADRAQGSDLRYYPFRLTPYQLTIRESDTAEPQPCCLLIAEKVHSGYEAPRIPTDKRIFTTSHSPSCVFQEVDERAVPLLGYLPQDLVGTPILLYLHPEDRPVMVAIHKKILQFAGQPFDHSPLRMCARNGEYLTIDTSWSSFVNPWSRKVAFIVGRHKVRTSPLNEDVFTTGYESRVTTPKIAELSERIHRLLVQPVHSNSSQGYSSLGSNGSRGSRCSHHQHLSASSSDSNSPTMEDAIVRVASHKPMTFQQICKDVHMVKTNGQQVFIESRNRPPLRKHANTGTANGLRTIRSAPVRAQPDMPCPPKDLIPALLIPKEAPTGYSYQQINCLDSIIRYLESCNIPNTVKRKCGSSSGTSTSDDDKQQESSGTKKYNKGTPVSLGREPSPLPPLMASKAESEVSVTSQCSFSSTIVHVGDKKPPESDIVMEEAPPTPTQAPSAAVTPAPPPPPPPPPQSPSSAPKPERDGGWRSAAGGGSSRLGLTKEVLSAHTQQEEQAFLDRFKDLSKLRVFDPTASSTVRCQTTPSNPLARGARCSRDYPGARGAGGSSAGGHRRGRGVKRLKHQETSDQHSSMGLSSSLAASAIHSQPLPLAAGGAPTMSSSWPASVDSQASMPSVPIPTGMLPMYPIYPPLSQHMQLPDPTRFPMMVVLPNYMFPQMGGPITQPMAQPIVQPMVQPMVQPLVQPMVQPMVQPGAGHFFNPNFPYTGPALPTLTPMPPIAAHPVVVPIPNATNAAASRCSTPGSGYRTADGAESPLFQSRCSSPLNLVQLDEAPSTTALGAAAQQATTPSATQANQRSSTDTSKENENGEDKESNNDAMSTSSDLLDLLLQEDSRSGTGSAASGSGSSGTGSSGSGSGSGSNGCSSSGTSGTRSSQSSHTSKYFGSIDSSENSRKQTAGGSVSAGGSGGDSGEEQFIKCVLQDPIWLLMANTDNKVMMTYQLPVRDVEAVLRKDREALRSMQKHQPRFTEEQKKELSQVHPWIRTGRLPRTINVSACTGCKSAPAVAAATPFDLEIHEMELCSAMDATLEAKKTPTSSSSNEAHGHEGEQADSGEGAKRQSGDQEMTPEEREEVTSSPAEREAGDKVSRDPR